MPMPPVTKEFVEPLWVSLRGNGRLRTELSGKLLLDWASGPSFYDLNNHDNANYWPNGLRHYPEQTGLGPNCSVPPHPPR